MVRYRTIGAEKFEEQRKTPCFHNKSTVFYLVGVAGLEPTTDNEKRLQYQCFLNAVSNFISNLNVKLIAGKESFHFSGILVDVFFRYMCVDVLHGFVVIPAANSLRDIDRHTDMNCE